MLTEELPVHSTLTLAVLGGASASAEAKLHEDGEASAKRLKKSGPTPVWQPESK
jgi:hypothetical protein